MKIHAMRERRFVRLCLLAIIATGTIGTLAVLAGSFDGVHEATAVFPLSAVGAMIGLHAMRPRYKRKAPAVGDTNRGRGSKG